MAVYLDKPQISAGYRPIPGGSWYTLRDEQGRVSTEFYESFPGRDNVYLGNLLVASYVSHANSGTVGWNFHTTDHLGTVRLTVNGTGGSTIESPKYWPYGDRFNSTGVPLQKMAFAAMERDGESNHYFDHARKQDFNLGRFVSPDVLGGKPGAPQSWNRYSYALGNPMRYVDPNGQEPLGFGDWAWIGKEAAAATVDDVAFIVARPLLTVGAGILNNDAGQFLMGSAEIAAAGALGGTLSYAFGPATAELTTVRMPNPYAPIVENARLQGTINQLFRVGDKIPGGTAGAIRAEGSHIQKGMDRIRELDKILKTENLSAGDRAAAQRVKADLEDAIRRRQLDLPMRPVDHVDK